MNAEESNLVVLLQKLHKNLQKAQVDEVELPMLNAEDMEENNDEEMEGRIAHAQH